MQPLPQYTVHRTLDMVDMDMVDIDMVDMDMVEKDMASKNHNLRGKCQNHYKCL